MNDSLASTSVLIISNDGELVDSLVKNNSTDKLFKVRDSVQQVLEDIEILDKNSLVILDVGSNGGDVDATVNQILKIKRQDPTQILILTGESEILANMLKSNVQPLIYRAFTKPISPNQVFLAFKSGEILHKDLVLKQSKGIDITTVGPSENKTNVASLERESKSKTPLFAGLGLVAIAIAGWLLFSDRTPSPEAIISEAIDTTSVDTEALDLPQVAETVTVSGRVQEINRLNQMAEIAVLEERTIAPSGENALEYYEQVLALDPYNTSAYQGKKAIAERLRESYGQMIKNAEFDKALNVVSVLQRIEPLNIQNDALAKDLEKAVDIHVRQVRESGSAEEQARTAAVVDNLGSKFPGSNSVSKALKKEKAMLSRIDNALESNNLVPPQQGNAYTLVSEALKANSISKANINPRVSRLSENILSVALSTFDQNTLAETEKLAALIKRLNVDREGLAALDKKLNDRKTAELEAVSEAQVAAASEVDEEEIIPEPPKIIPAKVISRTAPKYPSKALKRDAEGWVEVRFIIDASGMPIEIELVDSKPKRLFDSAALEAVEKWRFSPARNEETGLPVQSEIISTKVQFKLN